MGRQERKQAEEEKAFEEHQQELAKRSKPGDSSLLDVVIRDAEEELNKKGDGIPY